MEVSEGVQSLGRQGWNGRKCQEFSHWEDKTGMDGSVRRSSVIGKTRLVSGKTRLEWTEVSVPSVGRQGWNGRKCQFRQWEDKAGMDGSVRRSSVIGKTRLVSGKTRLEWTEVSEGVQSSSKDRSSLDGLIFTIFTAVPCVNVFDV